MATSREERMQQRIRGAQRHQVEDIDFGLILPIVEAEPSPPPPAQPTRSTRSNRSAPNTSAKRRRVDAQDAIGTHSSPSPTAGPSTAARRTSKPDPYDLPDNTSEETGGSRAGGATASLRRLRTQAHTRLSVVQHPDDADELETLPAPPPPPPPVAPPPRVAAVVVAEEVSESPAGAPGSGRRRRVRLSGAAESSALLQAVLEDEQEPDDTVQRSSPLTRKSMRSATSGVTRSAVTARTRRRSAAVAGQDDMDELSPPNPSLVAVSELPRIRPAGSVRHRGIQDAAIRQDDVDELSPPNQSLVATLEQPTSRVAGSARRRVSQGAAVRQEADSEEESEAEAVGEQEAATRLGRKRPRQSLRAESPELDSRAMEEAPRKRRRRHDQESPAKQKQPRGRKGRSEKPAKPAGTTRRKQAADKEDGDAADQGFEVQVQRYKRVRFIEDDSDADILNADIPFVNRGGVNSVDVLAQMCEEITTARLVALMEQASSAPNSAKQRELKTMFRTLEAFREELRTRLLEHTIALDSLYTLNKRVRAAQREKLALREEILRIRAEREQIALRMDAARIKHEEDSKEALHHLDLSSAMHDVDLAIERGEAAPPLSAAELKVAELANLELAISRIADQASSKSYVGGSLNQIKSFNAFLERTAAVLESR